MLTQQNLNSGEFSILNGFCRGLDRQYPFGKNTQHFGFGVGESVGPIIKYLNVIIIIYECISSKMNQHTCSNIPIFFQTILCFPQKKLACG